MAIYGVLGMVALFALVFGYGQWSTGATPWGAAVSLGAVGAIGFVYGAAFIGQGLGAEQMYELRRELDLILDELERDDARRG